MRLRIISPFFFEVNDVSALRKPLCVDAEASKIIASESLSKTRDVEKNCVDKNVERRVLSSVTGERSKFQLF